VVWCGVVWSQHRHYPLSGVWMRGFQIGVDPIR
jgi:hypothetical protein